MGEKYTCAEMRSLDQAYTVSKMVSSAIPCSVIFPAGWMAIIPAEFSGLSLLVASKLQLTQLP